MISLTYTIIRVLGIDLHTVSSMLESRTEVLSKEYGSKLTTCILCNTVYELY